MPVLVPSCTSHFALATLVLVLSKKGDLLSQEDHFLATGIAKEPSHTKQPARCTLRFRSMALSHIHEIINVLAVIIIYYLSELYTS